MKPLEGMRVLTLEQFGAGPYGSMFLADLGAEVIKVENVHGGDAARHVGPHWLGNGDSQYFQTWNMNKRSVALDIKTPEGRVQFERLAATADAVINNLRGDQPEKLGLDYASLRALNPKVVCLHISAYGRDNGRKAWPGYDFLMQAEAGLMSLTGEPNSPPSRVGVSMIDYMTGVIGVVGLLSCIMRARQTGIGCDVDASLFDVALHQLGYSAIWYLNEGDISRRLPRSAHLSIAPVQTFPTADGWIFIMCMTQKFWRIFCDVVTRPDLPEDRRFATADRRRENREALIAVLDQELRRHPTEHWLALLTGKVPVAPVYDVATALDAPFTRRTGMVQSVTHPARSELLVLATPLKIDGVRLPQRACASLGADNVPLQPEEPATA